MDSPLSVVISSPIHTPHKFTLDLSRQCTVLELKEIIVTRLDTKLTIADQRLIFGGRILDNKDTLGLVFEKVSLYTSTTCTTSANTYLAWTWSFDCFVNHLLFHL
jgi:hypothetical protein